MLPSKRCATPSFDPMLRLSSFESRNLNAEEGPITFRPWSCESAVIRSSEIPSEKYCSLASPLSFASGNTAIEAAPEALALDPKSPSSPKVPRARGSAAAITAATARGRTRFDREAYSSTGGSADRLRHFSRQQMLHSLDKSRGRLSRRQTRPLQLPESVRHLIVVVRRIVDYHRHQECSRGRKQMRPIDGQLPFQPEVTLRPCVGIFRK